MKSWARRSGGCRAEGRKTTNWALICRESFQCTGDSTGSLGLKGTTRHYPNRPSEMVFSAWPIGRVARFHTRPKSTAACPAPPVVPSAFWPPSACCFEPRDAALVWVFAAIQHARLGAGCSGAGPAKAGHCRHHEREFDDFLPVEREAGTDFQAQEEFL